MPLVYRCDLCGKETTDYKQKGIITLDHPLLVTEDKTLGVNWFVCMDCWTKMFNALNEQAGTDYKIILEEEQ